MRLLAVDTSTQTLALCLAEGEPGLWQIRYNFQAVGKIQHGGSLLPAVVQALESVAWQQSDLDAVAVGIGPGSYTGLRIGVTFAKTLAQSLNIPIYALSSLGVLASAHVPVESSQASTLLVPLMDARRLSAYAGVYQTSPEGLRTLQEDIHTDWVDFQATLISLAEQTQAQSIQLIGEGLEPFLEQTEVAFQDRDMNIEQRDGYQGMINLAPALNTIAWQEVEDVAVLTPNYAHATLAEREWAEKHHRQVATGEENEQFIERI